LRATATPSSLRRHGAAACVSKSFGTEEARLAYLAVKPDLGLGDGSMVIFDTGGGSGQFTFGRRAAVTEQFSLNVGAVRFTEKYGLARIVPPADLQRAMDAIAADLIRRNQTTRRRKSIARRYSASSERSVVVSG
jgi:exopolyphosphatase/pppGpp-phosphohydrolase